MSRTAACTSVQSVDKSAEVLAMLVRIVRALTALAVVGVCILVASRGSDIIRFSLADSVVNEARGPSADQVDAVRPWRDVSGLRFAAQASFLTVVRDPDAGTKARKRRR